MRGVWSLPPPPPPQTKNPRYGPGEKVFCGCGGFRCSVRVVYDAVVFIKAGGDSIALHCIAHSYCA